MSTILLETLPSLQIGSDAFRQEYSPRTNSDSLKKDIESYLGEYRFRVQKYEYELRYGMSLGGEIHLSDIDNREPMIDKAQRAIERRVNEGKNASREEAELEGLKNLETQLQHSNLGDNIIWVSPPGPKSDGYGDYGFVFLGKVDRVDGQNKHLSMSALRVEKPTLHQFNSLLTILTAQNFNFEKAEEFLAAPIVIPDFWVDSFYGLSRIFPLETAGDNDRLFKRIVPLLSPYIQGFIDLVKQGAPKDFLFQAFQTIELLTLDLIKEYQSDDSPQLYFIDRNAPLAYAMNHYQGKAPPKVAGSCGSTANSSGGLQSANVFLKFSILNDIFSDNADHKENSCGQCDKENDGHYHCPHCNMAYADETNVPADQRTKVCDGTLPNGQLCGFRFNC